MFLNWHPGSKEEVHLIKGDTRDTIISIL
jgi:hypothetical protein